MSLDRIGQLVLPHLDAVLGEAIEYLTCAQLYVGRWRDVLGV